MKRREKHGCSGRLWWRFRKKPEATAEKVSHCEHSVVHKQNLGRNTNVKGASGELSERNEEHVIGNWRKGHLYNMVENLPELCSFVRWKTEFTSDSLGYLAEEILKLNSFLCLAQFCEERDNLRRG